MKYIVFQNYISYTCVEMLNYLCFLLFPVMSSTAVATAVFPQLLECAPPITEEMMQDLGPPLMRDITNRPASPVSPISQKEQLVDVDEDSKEAIVDMDMPEPHHLDMDKATTVNIDMDIDIEVTRPDTPDDSITSSRSSTPSMEGTLPPHTPLSCGTPSLTTSGTPSLTLDGLTPRDKEKRSKNTTAL